MWEQYDTLIMANTMQIPGGDAGVVRVDGHPTKALAFSSDVTPRYCEADPFEGGKQAVAECWRNLTATGALPLAATDNLNFGNPERPEIMGQMVKAIEGIGAACRALEFPIVSGNVSLYNETNGQGILPTPTIGGVGLIDDWGKMARIGFAAEFRAEFERIEREEMPMFDAILAARKEAGLTQAQVAERMGAPKPLRSPDWKMRW